MSVRKLTYGGLLVALAIILPPCFYGRAWFGVSANASVLFFGFVCGDYRDVGRDDESILSSVITGMPPLDKCAGNGCGLALYGLITGVLIKTAFGSLHFSGRAR